MRRLIPSLLVIATAITAGCAKRIPPATTTTPATTRVELNNGGAVTLATNATVSELTSTVLAPVDRAWGIIEGVYADLGITAGVRNNEERRIGNEAIKVRRRLGSMSLSRMLDCGGTPGAPNADTYEVTLYVMTRLLPDAEGRTVVASTVTATARSTNFGRDVACTSLGTLEQRIVDRLRERLAAGRD
jgi:hypothetical protein